MATTDAQGSHSQSLLFSYDKVYHSTDFWNDMLIFLQEQPSQLSVD